MSSSATITPAIGTKGVPRPEREQQILAAALEEFAESGFGRASVVTIAARAGISKPLVYQYFGSKDGLYLACLNQVAGALLDRLEAAEQQVDDTVASRIHPLRAIFEALAPQRDAWRLIYDATMPTEGPIPATAAEYRRRTEQILLNLLNNAVKFTDRGEVTVDATRVPAFRLSAEAAPVPAVEVRIADTGVGIKSEDLPKLFQPFRQIDSGLTRVHEGTGLGLAICRRLATMLGGTISATSEWSRGSVFTVTLPVRLPSSS